MIILGANRGVSTPPSPESVLLLHFNGVDEATSTVDSSSYEHTITNYGGIALDTAQKKFGSASTYGPGGGFAPYWYTPTSTAFSFGIGDFTIELFVRIPSVVSGPSFLVIVNGTPEFHLLLEDGKVGFLNFAQDGIAAAGTVISVNTWTHVAVTRQAGTLRTFLAGVQQSEVAFSANLGTAGHAIQIPSTDITWPFTGHIDEVNITRNAKYTSNFTPPAGELS